MDDLQLVMDVLRAVQANFAIGRVFAAEEFRLVNSAETVAALERQLGEVPLEFEPHTELKKRVPGAIGLIRSADTTQYANLILESA